MQECGRVYSTLNYAQRDPGLSGYIWSRRKYTHTHFLRYIRPSRAPTDRSRSTVASSPLEIFSGVVESLWKRHRDVNWQKEDGDYWPFPFFLFFRTRRMRERESGRVWSSDLSIILFVDLLLFFLIFLDFRLFASVHASASLRRRRPRRIDRKYASWCLVRLYHASLISYIHTHRIIYRR